jgi:hypothetical protein
MKEKELLASDYMTYYIFHGVCNKDTVTTGSMNTERFAKKLNILEKLNLTYNKLHNSRDIITGITARIYGKLKELRYIGEVYTKEHNMLTGGEFKNLVDTIQEGLETVRIERNMTIEQYLHKRGLLGGDTELELTNSILEIVLVGVEVIENICSSYFKEFNEILPCEPVKDILEKGYTNILLEALDN